MKAIEALQDEAENLQKRLFYVIFEDLMQDPRRVMHDIYHWLALLPEDFDPQNLPVKAHESDSYYRFKYSHQTRTRLSPSQRHQIPQRIEADIQRLFVDFYQLFYPNLLQEKR